MESYEAPPHLKKMNTEDRQDLIRQVEEEMLNKPSSPPPSRQEEEITARIVLNHTMIRPFGTSSMTIQNNDQQLQTQHVPHMRRDSTLEELQLSGIHVIDCKMDWTHVAKSDKKK